MKEIKTPIFVEKIIGILNQEGYKAYVVGGSVRDSLLGTEPHDWDICTSATPQEVMECFKDYNVYPTGLKYGTVTIVGEDSENSIEVTTFRTEGSYKDGRRPSEVFFGKDIVADLSRRDFTMNAIAYNPITGELVDSFNGIIDIYERKINCVGNPQERFSEDGLRLMRAFRFAITKGFELGEELKCFFYQSIKTNDKYFETLLEKVSIERKTNELEKMIVYANQISSQDTKLWKALMKGAFGYEIEIIDYTDTIEKVLGYNLFRGIINIKNLKTFKLSKDIENRAKFISELLSLPKSKVNFKRLLRNSPSKILKDEFFLEKTFNFAELVKGDYSYRYLYNIICKTKECYCLKDLKITGKILKEEFNIEGEIIGEILNMLLEIIIENPFWNNRSQLLILANLLITKLTLEKNIEKKGD